MPKSVENEETAAVEEAVVEEAAPLEEPPGFDIPAPDPVAAAPVDPSSDEPDPAVVRELQAENPALLPEPELDYPAALTYTGPTDVLEIHRPDGTRGRVRRGETFKTTDEHAASLLEQGVWTQ